MNEHQHATQQMNHYLDLYVKTNSPAHYNKAIYWSTEADIEAYWQDFWKRTEHELNLGPPNLGPPNC